MNIFLSLASVFLFAFCRDAEIVQAAMVHQQDQGPAVQSERAIDERFSQSSEEFERRWKKFKKGRTFSRWTRGRANEEIETEFSCLYEDRIFTWYEKIGKDTPIRQFHPDYAIAEDLLVDDHVRLCNCVAFDYNKSCTYFNSSNVVINGLRFLAMEGTRSKDENGFFHLLLNYHVSHLVRLTGESEGSMEKCYPYWKNRTVLLQDPMMGTHYLLAVPRRDGRDHNIPYYFLETWPDNQGVDPRELLALIEATRKEYRPGRDIIAVHCSAGVGRTGTFIAGFSLLEDIDRQLAEGKKADEIDISIEETVAKLSLQRFHMVSKRQQYVTLYRLLDLYLTSRGN